MDQMTSFNLKQLQVLDAKYTVLSNKQLRIVLALLQTPGWQPARDLEELVGADTREISGALKRMATLKGFIEVTSDKMEIPKQKRTVTRYFFRLTEEFIESINNA